MINLKISKGPKEEIVNVSKLKSRNRSVQECGVVKRSNGGLRNCGVVRCKLKRGGLDGGAGGRKCAPPAGIEKALEATAGQ